MRLVSRVPADGGPRCADRVHGRPRAGHALRGRFVSQALPAERPGRDRPDAAPRRQDPRLRGETPAAASLALPLNRMKIAVLPGDGIGKEIVAQALRVLRGLELPLELEEAPVGGAGDEGGGDPLPEATLRLARGADAIP